MNNGIGAHALDAGTCHTRVFWQPKASPGPTYGPETLDAQRQTCRSEPKTSMPTTIGPSLPPHGAAGKAAAAAAAAAAATTAAAAVEAAAESYGQAAIDVSMLADIPCPTTITETPTPDCVPQFKRRWAGMDDQRPKVRVRTGAGYSDQTTVAATTTAAAADAVSTVAIAAPATVSGGHMRASARKQGITAGASDYEGDSDSMG